MTAATDESERNRAAAQEMYAAAKAGDVETFFSFIDSEIVVEEPVYLPYGGIYEGIDGLQRLFAILAAQFDLSGLDFERIVADGDYICVIGTVPLADGSGTAAFIERARMRNGKAVDLRIYMYDAASLVQPA